MSRMGNHPLFRLAITCGLCGLLSCKAKLSPEHQTSNDSLVVVGVASEKNNEFEQKFFASFGIRHGVKTRYVPTIETPDSRLSLYKKLLREHSAQPDLLQIDVAWPAELAENLVDLTPYFQKEIPAYSPDLLKNYYIRGRLVAMPTLVDIGVLYYRPLLLRKYGFSGPPKSWEELEKMAQVVQSGERRAGNKNFWGYVWQGGSHEALTCNALEWQRSMGMLAPVEQDGSIHVRDPLFIRSLQRASDWIGKISPPGEYMYLEQDSGNVWNAGNTVFLRHWASSYGHFAIHPGGDRERFEVAPLPGGPGGRHGTLGGLGIGVSMYSRNRVLAIAALKELTSEDMQIQRAIFAGSIPARKDLSRMPAVMQYTSIHGQSAVDIMNGLVSRPSMVTGEHYNEFSHAYYTAVNSVLRHQKKPEEATAELELELTKIPGLHKGSKPR